MCVLFTLQSIVHVIIYEAKRSYAFRSYLYNIAILTQFFQSKRITKKIVKVIEDDIYGKLFEIYKETEKGRVS